MSAKFSFVNLLAFGTLVCVGGCGVDVASLANTVQEIQSKQGAVEPVSEISEMPTMFSEDETFLTAIEGTGENSSLPGAFSPPYPDRFNPFEFGIEVSANSTPAAEGKLEVELYGFVGNENPRAIIHLGNQTRMMAVGEQWERLEIVEIDPPVVRIRTDGLVRTWSLLGRGQSKVD